MESENDIKTAIIGHPISHSLSPVIHHYWCKKYDISVCYEVHDTPINLLNDKIAWFVKNGYKGFNITIPHKQAVFHLCHHLDEVALQAGAVNMVEIKDGKLFGRNTDCYGFQQSIESKDGFAHLPRNRAVILGAGGASMALILALKNLNFNEIIITNRTQEKIASLIKRFPFLTPIAWDEKETILDKADLLVNGTSLGMVGMPDLQIDLSPLPAHAWVADIVYRPHTTPLLQSAKDKGHFIIHGIDMLLYQAVPAFSTWFSQGDIIPTIDQGLMDFIAKELNQT